MEFTIIDETDDLLAVDKPAGMLVHPTKPGGPRTLWDGLRDLLGYELATGGQVSIVNRLDRETSGVVVVAKTAEAARAAGLAMQRGAMRKRYVAIVFGWPEWDCREVEAPILRKGEVAAAPVWLERSVHPAGQPARTAFRVCARARTASGGRVAVVAAQPHTGRTHQIRVHLAHIGHPVVGDKIYARGSQRYLEFIADGWTPALAGVLWLSRHALHCAAMAWGQNDWRSPVPADMRGLVPEIDPAHF